MLPYELLLAKTMGLKWSVQTIKGKDLPKEARMMVRMGDIKPRAPKYNDEVKLYTIKQSRPYFTVYVYTKFD